MRVMDLPRPKPSWSWATWAGMAPGKYGQEYSRASRTQGLGSTDLLSVEGLADPFYLNEMGQEGDRQPPTAILCMT